MRVVLALFAPTVMQYIAGINRTHFILWLYVGCIRLVIHDLHIARIAVLPKKSTS